MKIGFLGWGQVNTGGNRILFEQANCLLSAGHKVDVFFHGGGQPDWIQLNTTVQSLPPFDLSPLVNQGYDLVIATAWPIHFALRDFPTLPGVGLLQAWDPLTVRSDEVKCQLALKAMRYPIPKLTVSDWLTHLLKKETGQTAIQIPNGIHVKDIQALCVSKPVRSTCPRIGIFSATYSELKGLDLAVEVMQVLHKRRSVEFVLVSAKPKPFHPDFDQFISQPSRKEALGVMQSVDVVFSPSVMEGFGLVPLEAMAVGTPVVATDSLGVRSYATSQNGVWVSNRSADTVADAIEEVLDSKSKREAMAQAGLKTVQNWDWEVVFPKIESVYQDLVKTQKVAHV